MEATFFLDNVCPPDWERMFRTIWPRHTRKELQRAAGISERRAKYLVEGKTPPTADEMFRLSLHSRRAQRELWRAWLGAAHQTARTRSAALAIERNAIAAEIAALEDTHADVVARLAGEAIHGKSPQRRCASEPVSQASTRKAC